MTPVWPRRHLQVSAGLIATTATDSTEQRRQSGPAPKQPTALLLYPCLLQVKAGKVSKPSALKHFEVTWAASAVSDFSRGSDKAEWMNDSSEFAICPPTWPRTSAAELDDRDR